MLLHSGLLKKKKKAKTSPSPEGQSSKAKSGASKKSDEATLTEKAAEVVEAVVESPATAPVVAVAASSLAAVGA